MSKQVWQAEDGSVHETKKAADDHEAAQAGPAKIRKYMDSLEPLPVGQYARMARIISEYEAWLVAPPKPAADPNAPPHDTTIKTRLGE